MEWLNENSGVMVLILSLIIIALIGLSIWLLFNMRSKIAVQRLNFLGFYTVNKETRVSFAEITIGNKSLNDVGLTEIGIQNGNVNFPFTDVYRKQQSISDEGRIVLQQRSSISFELSCEELQKLVIERNGRDIVSTLRVYAVDTTGTCYRGKIPAIRKLVLEMLAQEEEEGTEPAPNTGAADTENK